MLRRKSKREGDEDEVFFLLFLEFGRYLNNDHQVLTMVLLMKKFFYRNKTKGIVQLDGECAPLFFFTPSWASFVPKRYGMGETQLQKVPGAGGGVKPEA